VSIDAVISRMTDLGEELRADGDRRIAFHDTYLRTTRAVADALNAGFFADPDWVERWDVAFARLYLDALAAARQGQPVAKPWEVAFGTAANRQDLPPLRHVLLGMNAHINYDLPQALLAVISDEEFGDAAVRAAREADHRRIDDLLSERVSAEDEELKRLEISRSLQDRLLEPLNRMATRRFLREARARVWANALALSGARQQGDGSLPRELAALEELSGARVADLVQPGPVLLRLATGGFGVRLPAAAAGSDGRAPAGTGAVTRSAAATGGGAWPGRRKPSGLRNFDPVTVGGLECALWAAYYRREWARFLLLSVRVVKDTFGLDWERTVHAAWLVLRANQLWAPASNDPAGARRCMTRFYALLRLAHGEPADPRHAARLEVDWWAAHREHQHDGKGDDSRLVDALTLLYAYVYDAGEDAVRPAAKHRAQAMDVSGQWVAEGCAMDSPLLDAERAALVRSYAELRTAVHHPAAPSG
jgi:Family of unknown function (DUF5995)